MGDGPSAHRRLVHHSLGLNFALAVQDLADVPLTRYPTLPFMPRAYELRSNVTAYAAAYIALAEVLATELITADERLLMSPGVGCSIRVLR